MKVLFKNKTGQAQHINTMKEGFTIDQGGELSVEWNDLAKHERDRLENFFDFQPPREEREKKPAPPVKQKEPGEN